MQTKPTTTQSPARTDWTTALVAYGNSLGWPLYPPKRGLRSFRQFAGIASATGFSADYAFRLQYHALRIATPEERAACTTQEAVKALLRRQRREAADKLDYARRERLASCMAQADKAGWRLIAGEESAVVAAGTLADVENSDAMRRMLNEPRALGEGVGCWIITAPDGVEYRSGQFDANAWW